MFFPCLESKKGESRRAGRNGHYFNRAARCQSHAGRQSKKAADTRSAAFFEQRAKQARRQRNKN